MVILIGFWLNVIATLTFTHLYSFFVLFCVRCGISTGVAQVEETTISFLNFFVDGDKANNAYNVVIIFRSGLGLE